MRGYSALVSTLILSTILMVVVFATSAHAFLSRINTSTSEYYLQTQRLSDSCGAVALVYVVADQNYHPKIGGDVVTVTPTKFCYIDSVIFSGSTVTIQTHALVQNTFSVTEVVATIDTNSASPVTVQRWRQIKKIGI